MSRWKGLPGELDPRVRQLVVGLRRVKDRSGLSLRRLAARTGYSTSSWERYLSGRALPPREAVEAIARLGDDDPARLLALHEVAAEVWGRAPDGAPAPRPPAVAGEAVPEGEDPGTRSGAGEVPRADPSRSRGRVPRVTLVAGAVALVAAVAAAVLLAARLSDGEKTAAAPPLTGTSAAVTAPGTAGEPDRPVYTCRSERIDGRWYAGNSRTMKAVLAKGHAGPEVAEAQCLLREAGHAPGVVDGIFGPHTERAVRGLQKRSGLVVDGIIGPHTWKALRE
ncbi:peptidoglycan-binding protein [Streptomyces sp. NPDC057837]|uniref:peptidoglycan-binding protein n=1 Tax=Streptomyces sp. NPDC057837 TaxID=3346260 RepID=UPI00369AC82B